MKSRTVEAACAYTLLALVTSLVVFGDR